jgi:hypothetical protein
MRELRRNRQDHRPRSRLKPTLMPDALCHLAGTCAARGNAAVVLADPPGAKRLAWRGRRGPRKFATISNINTFARKRSPRGSKANCV